MYIVLMNTDKLLAKKVISNLLLIFLHFKNSFLFLCQCKIFIAEHMNLMKMPITVMVCVQSYIWLCEQWKAAPSRRGSQHMAGGKWGEAGTRHAHIIFSQASTAGAKVNYIQL